MMDYGENNLGDLARFMRFVQISDLSDCWAWLGNRPSGSYGHFSIKSDAVKAHRWIYALCCGQIDDGMVIRHKCDNPWCVNPTHLTIGTHRQNVIDMYERGRNPNRQGENHPLAKLTEADVRAIRRVVSLGESHPRVAATFGVSRSQIQRILSGKNWGHVQ